MMVLIVFILYNVGIIVIIILYTNYNVILSLVGTSYEQIICTVMSLSRCGLTISKNLFWIGAPPIWILILNVLHNIMVMI